MSHGRSCCTNVRGKTERYLTHCKTQSMVSDFPPARRRCKYFDSSAEDGTVVDSAPAADSAYTTLLAVADCESPTLVFFLARPSCRAKPLLVGRVRGMV